MIKINEAMKFRKFTKNDWYGFAGATRSSDGKYPIIAENDDITIIVCPSDINSSKFIVNVITPDTEDFGGKVKVFNNENAAVSSANLLAKSSVKEIEDTIRRW